MMVNLFNYFLPTTLTRYVFDVNEPFPVNARGQELTITGPGFNTTTPINIFPHTVSASVNGTHTIRQRVLGYPQPIEESFFIRIAREQSDFSREGLRLENPNFPDERYDPINWELMIILASIFVALLFIERLLHLPQRY